MDNGCPVCKKQPGNRLCDTCELGMLQYMAEAAMHTYIKKVNEILTKLKEKRNAY